MPRLAQQLADRLGQPFVPVVTKPAERPEQRHQQNSAHQQHNVEGFPLIHPVALASLSGRG